MIVPDEIRKCVAFIGFQMADNSFRMAGSAFFIGRGEEGGNAKQVYLTTACHVIDGIKGKGIVKVHIRMNHTAGNAVWIETNIADWFSHPTDKSIDIAILPCRIPPEFDHRVIPFSMCATEEKIKTNEVGLGDEVFVTGLFRHHHGNRRNVPIVRIGNIACLVEEKISTNNYGEIDAYLIECRSIGGLSGSPVFLNLGFVRHIQGQIKYAQGGAILLLFGLIHGHYDSKVNIVDEVHQDDLLTPERVNTGIAIVVPFQRIEEVISLYEASKKLPTS
jgi:hypothetical protein